MKNNTFGSYEFESWVPERERQLISEFWGQAGRTYINWLENGKLDERELCSHGPNPDGFGNPPMGARAQYFIYEYKLSQERGLESYTSVTGKYLHRWNNIGVIIDDKGVSHSVSSCDVWSRIFTGHEERRFVLKK